jgi:hypothetical protein
MDGSAIPKSDGSIHSTNGQIKPKLTTRGWFLLVQWRDRSTSWEKLKDLKKCNPVEVAEYAIANRIVDEPAFKWWVPHVIQRRNHIISKVKSRYWTTTHKFGICLPKNVEVLWHSTKQLTPIFGAKQLTRRWPKSRLHGQSMMLTHRNRYDKAK